MGDDERNRYNEAQVRRWLTVLARYLNDNATPQGRDVGERSLLETRTRSGKRLSATHIELHDLWPLVGRRAHGVACFLIAVMSATVPLYLALSTTGFAAATSLIWVLGITFIYGLLFLPQIPPARLGTRHQSERRGDIALVFAAGMGMGILPGLQSGLVSGLLLGLLFGSLAAAGIALMTHGSLREGNPTAALRADLIAAVTIAAPLGLAAGLAGGVAAGFAVAANAVFLANFAVMSVDVFVLRLVEHVRSRGVPGSSQRLLRTFAPVPGLVGLRYLALLLTTRWGATPLPWRLGHFLNWCYKAGLVRKAGVAYQFRHQELQDYLARRPTQ